MVLVVHIPRTVVYHLCIVAREALAAQQLLLLLHQIEIGVDCWLRSHGMIRKFGEVRIHIRHVLLVFVTALAGEHLQVLLAQCLTLGYERHGC